MYREIEPVTSRYLNLNVNPRVLSDSWYVCVCVRVRACVRVCACVCMCSHGEGVSEVRPVQLGFTRLRGPDRCVTVTADAVWVAHDMHVCNAVDCVCVAVHVRDTLYTVCNQHLEVSSSLPDSPGCTSLTDTRFFLSFDAEYIYGFVGWGGLQAKLMTSQRYRATYKMADMRYYGNVMTTTRWRLYVILHLQQYSRRLNFFLSFSIV